MNAIILAGGKSSSMYATGATVHKALLPIMGIPNIERTIMMLHDYHISDIIIAVSILNHDFDYLTKKYSCRIEYIPIEGKKYPLYYEVFIALYSGNFCNRRRCSLCSKYFFSIKFK